MIEGIDKPHYPLFAHFSSVCYLSLPYKTIPFTLWTQRSIVLIGRMTESILDFH